jgi:hypothetical protein
MTPALLIAGGAGDPCLRLLAKCCSHRGVPYMELFHQGDREPSVGFDLRNGDWWIDGQSADIRAAFIRMDVFSAASLEDIETLPKSAGWFAWTLGVVSMFPDLRMFNRSMKSTAGLKLTDLMVARECGLAIPETLISNDAEKIVRFSQQHDGAVAKPVNGGGYCKPLAEVFRVELAREGIMPIPAFIQEKLSYPEFRVYRIGKRFMAFKIESSRLDYRISSESTMEMVMHDVEPLAREMPLMSSMAEMLGLDFCAFDLKTGADGRLRFLEVNTGPMFAAHDSASGGRLTEMIIEELWPA